MPLVIKMILLPPFQRPMIVADLVERIEAASGSGGVLPCVISSDVAPGLRTWHRREGERNLFVETALVLKPFDRGALSVRYLRHIFPSHL
jgi:hypothetical protein